MKKAVAVVIVIACLSISSHAFAETYVDSKAEFKIPIGQERQDDIANKIKTAVGKEFVITLDANATTGYEWQLAAPTDNNLISLVCSEYVPYKTGLVGSGGKSIWIFKALKAGKAQVSFKYIRVWEKNTPPVKEVTYIVTIQG